MVQKIRKTTEKMIWAEKNSAQIISSPAILVCFYFMQLSFNDLILW